MSNDNRRSESELQEKYGAFCREESLFPPSLDPDNIPRELWPLIPYAEFWGIGDDIERDHLVRSVPREALEELLWAIEPFEGPLDSWLCGPEAKAELPSEEYAAFAAMFMAADYATVRLDKMG